MFSGAIGRPGNGFGVHRRTGGILYFRGSGCGGFLLSAAVVDFLVFFTGAVAMVEFLIFHRRGGYGEIFHFSVGWWWNFDWWKTRGNFVETLWSFCFCSRFCIHRNARGKAVDFFHCLETN